MGYGKCFVMVWCQTSVKQPWYRAVIDLSPKQWWLEYLLLKELSFLTLLGTLLLTWINFNPSMDKYSHAQLSVGWNCLSIPKLQWLHHWSLGMDTSFYPTLYNGWNYSSMLGLKLHHVSKRAPRSPATMVVIVCTAGHESKLFKNPEIYDHSTIFIFFI